jgi:AraC-like DNA-binding protein
LVDSYASDGHLRITHHHEQVVLTTLMKALNDPTFGARAGMDMSPHTGSILAYILFASPSLGDMVSLMARYIPLTRTDAEIRLDEMTDEIAIRMSSRNVVEPRSDGFETFATGALLRILREAVGRDTLGERAHLTTTDPVLEPAFTEIYGCTTRLGQPANVVFLPAEVLSLPLIEADTALLTHLKSYGDILLEHRRPRQPTIIDDVEATLLQNLPHGAPSLQSVAETLGQSPRTLARRLAEHDRTFRDIRETLRHNLARDYLAEPRLPLAEVAFLLGFSDQSSFGAAFARWQGISPGQFRKSVCNP